MLFQMVMLHDGKMPIEVLKASRNAGKYFERDRERISLNTFMSSFSSIVY